MCVIYADTRQQRPQNSNAINTEQFIHDFVSLQPAMRHIAEQVLHDPEAAADAVQETFAKLWHLRWRLAVMKNPQGFAMTMCRNQSLQMLRKRNRLVPLAEAAYRADNAQEARDAEARFQRLEEALDRLPPLWQQLVRMRYTEQLSTREMAARLAMSEERVNTAMSRAYKRLKTEMADQI